MRIIILSFFLAAGCIVLNAQGQFEPDEYIKYREQIKDMTKDEILQKYPAPSVYYSARQKPSLISDFEYLDTISGKFGLTNYELDLFSDNHLMVSERLFHSSFAYALLNIYFSDVPLFLSTDLFIHALHISYDNMLRDLEYQLLEPNLSALLSSMRNEIPGLYSASTQPGVIQAVKDADLYLTVAISLLNGEKVEPLYDNSGNFKLLMDGIESESGILEGSFFADHKRKLDVSQFKPRGHYAGNFWTPDGEKNLQDYFRVMTWLGRIDLYLTAPPSNPWEEPWSDNDIRRMQMTSLILNELIEISGSRELLELHEKIITFFVGDSDNMTPKQMFGLVNEMNITPVSLLDTETFNAFTKKMGETNDYGQKIMSAFFYVDPDTTHPSTLPVSYRMLGQKFILDSYIFAELVYDRIVYNGVKYHRHLPDPLDMLFVLGNDNALPLLEEDLEEYHYAYKLEGLRFLVDQYDDQYWESSLYSTWLKAIKSLNPRPENDNLPFFMQTTEWQLEKMNTQLASWAELRHDNILYAKQSYTGGTGCTYQHVYLEPYPEFYETLGFFAENAESFFRKELAGYSVKSYDAFIQYYEGFAEIMHKLESIAKKELRKEAFTNEEICWLKSIVNGGMSSGPSIDGWYLELFYDLNNWTNYSKAMNEDFIVADVHTQPTDEFGALVGHVLHVGTGKINLAVVGTGAPSNNYKPTAFIGPVMSFHTKITDNFYRYNDQEWADLLWGGKIPDRPDWVNNYLADLNGEKRGEGRTLKGTLFTGTGIENDKITEDIAYFISKPNPAVNSSLLKFLLNNPVHVTLTAYDVLGRRVETLINENIAKGEHGLEMNVENYPPGLYYLDLRAGNKNKILKLIVK